MSRRRLGQHSSTASDSSVQGRALPAGSRAVEARRVPESELGSPTARGHRTGMSTGESKDSGDGLACGQCRCSCNTRGRIDLMTLDDFLELVGIARSTFHDWAATGRAPARIKLPNGAIRFRASEVERWLGDCENGGQA
jgi:predicted DNA-binding transcriptional regulator AlpA